MGKVIDLDDLVPPSVTVKFNNKEIEIKPPKTGDLLKLGTLGSKLKDADKASPEEVTEMIGELTAMIKTIVPELEGEMTTNQLFKLSEIVLEMAKPTEKQELDKQKVTSTTDPKVLP